MPRFRKRHRCCEQAAIDSLTSLKSGEQAQIAAVNAGCKARTRLASLGIVPGATCCVLASAGAGPMLLAVGDSRLMLERGVADKVEVRQASMN